MNFGGIVAGLGSTRLNYSQVQQQHQAEDQAQQERVKQIMFKMALEKAAHDQTQSNADRQAGMEAQRIGIENQRVGLEGRRVGIEENKPFPVPATPRIDPLSKEGLAARVAEARALAGIPTYGQAHPKEQTVTLPDGTTIQGGGKAPKPPTEAQAKANSYLKLAEAEEPTIEGMTSNLPNKYMNKIPVLGNIITGKNNPKYQAQVAAGERFINQYLRFQSGAAISESEFENARKQFIPQPGDTEETIKAKESARHRVIEGLREATRQGSTPGSTPSQEESPAQVEFKAASVRLNSQYDAAITRGVNPSLAQMVLDREMTKLRKRK